MQKRFLIGFTTLPLTLFLSGIQFPVSAQMCDPSMMSCPDQGMSSGDFSNNDSIGGQNQPTYSDYGSWDGSGGTGGWSNNGGFEGHGNSHGGEVMDSGGVCDTVVNAGCQFLGNWGAIRTGGASGAAIGTGANLGCSALANAVCHWGEE